MKENPKPTSTKTCAECRFHSTYKRPRIMDATGFDDQLMFEDADKDETVYVCRAKDGPHKDKEIGLVPITCEAWTETVPVTGPDWSEIDRKIAAFEKRISANKEKDQK